MTDPAVEIINQNKKNAMEAKMDSGLIIDQNYALATLQAVHAGQLETVRTAAATQLAVAASTLLLQGQIAAALLEGVRETRLAAQHIEDRLLERFGTSPRVQVTNQA
jgi:hypothetical protein